MSFWEGLQPKYIGITAFPENPIQNMIQMRV